MSQPNRETQALPPPNFLDADARQALTDLLEETHPQVALAAFQDVETRDAAVFLAICTHEAAGTELAAHAGHLFAALPVERQVAIAERVASVETVESDDARRIWTEQIQRIKTAIEKTTFLGEGTATLAKLLTHLDVTAQHTLLERLGETAPTLANSVSEQLLSFEDLGALEDGAIRTILQILDKATLALALHEAPGTVRDRFYENMSASEAEAVDAESARLTFEQTQIADTARASVVQMVRNFAAKGLLNIG